MKKIICITVVAMIFIATLGFTPYNTSDGDCSDNMEGSNPQRTNSFPNCNLEKSRLACKEIFKDLFAEYESPRSIQSVHDDIIVVNTHRFNEYETICIDMSNNKILWRKDAVSNIVCFNNSMYYIFDKKLYCCDLYSGEIRWEKEFDYSYYNSILACEDGFFLGLPGSLTCYNLETGDVVWTKEIKNPYPYTSYAEPNIAHKDGYIFYFFSGVYCIDAHTGELFWEQTKYSDSELFDKYLICYNCNSLLLSNESIIVSKGEFGFVTLNIDTGGIILESDYTMSTNYAIINDHLISDQPLSIVSIKDSRTIWESDVVRRTTSIKTTSDYIISIYDNLGKYMSTTDINNGKQLWIHEFKKSKRTRRLKMSNSRLYTLDDKKLYCFSPAPDSLIFQIGSNTYKPDNDEKIEMDSEPTILQDRTYLPARYVCEPLGGQVFWDGEERKVTCKLVAPDNAETKDYKENIVELWIGKSTAKLNGVEVQIDSNNPDVVPTIINDRTMVPMRFLAESLGCEVEWLAESKEIILTYTP